MTQIYSWNGKQASMLDVLLSEKRKAIVKLDLATSELDSFKQNNNGDDHLSLPEYENLQANEKTASMEWTSIYEAILNFVPETLRESSLVMLAVLDFISDGYDDARLQRKIRSLVLDLEQYS